MDPGGAISIVPSDYYEGSCKILLRGSYVTLVLWDILSYVIISAYLYYVSPLICFTFKLNLVSLSLDWPLLME